MTTLSQIRKNKEENERFMKNYYNNYINPTSLGLISRMIKKGGFFTMAASSDESLPNLTRVENERYMTIIGEKIICPDYQSHLYRIIQAAPIGSIIMTHITRFNTTDQSFSPEEQSYIDASRGAEAKLGGRRRRKTTRLFNML